MRNTAADAQGGAKLAASPAAVQTTPRPLRRLQRQLAEPLLVPQTDTRSIVDGSSGAWDGSHPGAPDSTAGHSSTARAAVAAKQTLCQPRPPPTGMTAVGDPNLGPSLSPATDPSALLPTLPKQQQQQRQQAMVPFGYASPALKGLLSHGSGGGGGGGGGGGSIPPQGRELQHGVPPLQPPDAATAVATEHQQHDQQQQWRQHGQQQHLASDGVAGAAPTLGQVQRRLHLQHPLGLQPLGQQDAAGLSAEDERRLAAEEAAACRLAMRNRTLSSLTAGGIAGAVSRTATAPVDRLKMLMQIADSGSRLTVRGAFRQMSAEGTLRAFFRGNGANVVKIAPETALKLTFNDKMKALLVADPHDITPGERMLAGALAGASAQAIIYPLELIKTRLAVSPAGSYTGIAHCAAQVLRHEGWRSFYRGMLPSMIGIIPYAGVDITAFELLKQRLLEEHDGRPPPPAVFAAGMLSSCVAQFVSYPLALVRTRMQAQGLGGVALKYTGMWDVLSKTVRHEGFFGLYKGVLPNLFKLAPAAGISWFTFEEVKRQLGVDINS